ncbi:MAG: TonB-dependent receptor [Cyanobacteria bacterium P01_G01_bin.54]
MAKHLWSISLTTLAGTALLTMPPAAAETWGANIHYPKHADESEGNSQDSLARLQEFGQPATSLAEWQAQLDKADEAAQVIAVELASQARRLEIILKTDQEDLLQVDATQFRVEGNSLLATIGNANLNLTDAEVFTAANPTADIAQVVVSPGENNTIEIIVTGNNTPPTTPVTVRTGFFAYALNSGSDADELRILVTGDQDSYLVPDASTATRTDTPLRDIPHSIQVIPRQIIEDQQAIRLEDVLQNAAGVISLGNEDGRGSEFSIRGFDDAPVLRDGFRLPVFAGDPAGAEVANLERVEVLRGPASILYGQVEPGGVISLVTKQPLSEPYYNIQLQGGSRDFLSSSIDLSGPLTEDGRLLYRLNMLYRQEDSFRDYDNNLERFFIGPSLTFLIDDRTDLNISLEYVKDNEPANFGTIALGDTVAPVPLERVTNNPGDIIEQTYFSLGYTLEHRFNDNWQLRNQFRYISSSFDYGGVFPFPAFPQDDSGDLPRLFVARNGEMNAYSLYTNIQGTFKTGSIKHTLLAGVDLVQWREFDFQRFDFAAPNVLNLFNPDYPDPATFPADEDIPIVVDRIIETKQLGIYLQDQIDLTDNLIVVAGLRYDAVDFMSTDSVAVFFEPETEQYNDAVIPRIGVVYQPIEPISLYASYARSFSPNFATDADGNILPPEEGEGLEVGIRGEMIKNRLAATLAYFDITKQNVATADPNNLIGSVATGEQRSRGIDFNLTGEILPGWNIIASYAYIDAEVTEDNDIDLVGNRLFGAPENSASLWTSYEIQSGELQGWGLGLGFNFVGERQGDLDNTFKLDSYFVTNAAVFYRQDNWQFRLNIDNLFDIDYIESNNGSRIRAYPGDPLTVRASFSYTF